MKTELQPLEQKYKRYKTLPPVSTIIHLIPVFYIWEYLYDSARN